MPLTLAIDCSLRWISIGLADGDIMYGEENTNTGPKQSEVLANSTEKFLMKSGFNLSDIRQIAITTGPGYYTGIRVGISYATLLAESLGIKTVPISTLQVIAWELINAGITAAPVIRARKGAIYAAIFSSQKKQVVPAGFYRTDEFIGLLNSCDCEKNKIITTAVRAADTEEFDAIKNAGFTVINTAPALGLKLALAAQNFESIDPADVTATYLREPD